MHISPVSSTTICAQITTSSGILVNVFNLEDDDIRIEDIAHGLSNISRFGGQTRPGVWYSVAQHSFYASYMVHEPFRLAALLHDAPEAYLCSDIPTPIKKILPDYQRLEALIAGRIATSFGLPVNAFELEPVKIADTVLLTLEADQVLTNPKHIHDKVGKADITIHTVDPRFSFWTPAMARDRFIGRYEQLRREEREGRDE